ncbi:Acriflavine sensitivity control protein acr-2 [Pseudocercospora fuligena]|uniref:Acriflavine sensitivity control protein acr-2 n=1 Tax=Pseudocercospora fuligena TaxID=685502 RepID=A0A8H6R5Z4_9PEZI|nr:Acriflavine sensitivity control protein acr-2 [Pseudocercospora fuligena]
MSLRISSLDPSEPRASKDCRLCNRRRIKCDRSLPTCKKCDLRSLDCPGYGLRIRWDQGVASRGKLSGKALPIEDSPAVKPGAPIRARTESSLPSQTALESTFQSTQSAPTWSPSPAPTASSSSSSHPSPRASARIAISSLLSPSVPDDNEQSPLPRTPDYTQYNTGFNLNNPHALNIDFRNRPLLPPLRDPCAQQLLNYYDHIVSATFPWIEGPENHWRTVMIPLALECHSLLLALLAMAAEAYHSKHGREWYFQHISGPAQLRNECIQVLAHDLHAEMTDEQTFANVTKSSGILATILALCNLEMIKSDSALWRVHWSAARTITRRWTMPPRSPTSLDYNCRFLVVDAFFYDAFASTTTFDGNTPIPGEVVHPDDVDIFIEYFQLIQQITSAERSRHESGPGGDTADFLRSKISIRQEFEAVRLRNKGFDTLFQLASASRRHDFNAVIDMFHFAGLLYAYQVMLSPRDSEAARQECAETFVECRRQIHSVEGIQHDFVWPLFIVGTEARGHVELQRFIEDELLDAMSQSGWGNCVPALEFLRRFWQTGKDEMPNWMRMAREESKRGYKFLVI